MAFLAVSRLTYFILESVCIRENWAKGVGLACNKSTVESYSDWSQKIRQALMHNSAHAARVIDFVYFTSLIRETNLYKSLSVFTFVNC